MAKPEDGYPIKVLCDAGWAGWEALEDARKDGFCVPGNNMVMVSVARRVLAELRKWDRENPQMKAGVHQGETDGG